MNAILKTTALILFFVFVALLLHQPIETEDIWWHLKIGEYMAQNGQVPFYDPFPYTTEVTPWILTQWGGSLFYYTVYSLTGLEGLKSMRVILGVLIFIIFLMYARRKIPLLFAFLLMCAFILPVEGRAFLRPLIFNFIFVQILFITLLAHRDSSTWRPLWIIPLMGIFWVNIHIGSFMYAVPIMGIFLFDYFIQFIQNRKNEPAAAVRYRQKCEHIAALLAVYLCLFLLTPYGLEGFLYPFKVVFIPDYLEFDAVSRSISELMPPIYMWNIYYLWFYLLAAAVILCLIKFKTNRFLYTLLFAFATYMFLHSVRASALYSLTCGYILLDLLGREKFHRTWDSFRHSRIAERALLGIAAVVFCLLILRGINSKVYINGKTHGYLTDLTLNPDNPSGALKFLQDNGIQGHVFNSMKYGGFMFWHTYPDLKPFTDSRFSDLPAFFAFMAVQKAPEKAWPVFESIYPVDILLLQSDHFLAAKSTLYFKAHPDWQLIHIEGNRIVFVRKGTFDLPDHLQNYEMDLEQKDLHLKEVLAEIPDYPVPSGWEERIKKIFFPAYHYIDIEQTAYTLYNLGYQGIGIELMRESLERIDDPASRWNLRQMKENLKQNE